MIHVHMCVCVIKYYTAFKTEENLSCVTTWVNLENAMLSEVRQMQKDKYCMISFICHLYVEPIVILTEAESRMVVARAWGKREMGRCCTKGTQFLLRKIFSQPKTFLLCCLRPSNSGFGKHDGDGLLRPR